MEYLRLLDTDLASRLGVIGGVQTPAMSISKDNKIVIFENFQALEDRKSFFELDAEKVLHAPILINQFKAEAVREAIEDFSKVIGEKEIISISFYKDPTVYDSLGIKKPKMVIIKNVVFGRSIRTFIRFITHLRKILPVDTAIMISSYIPWKFLPFVIYLGIDIIDVSPYFLNIYREKENAIIGRGSPFIFFDLGRDLRGLDTDEKLEMIKNINKKILDKIFKDFRKMIRKGTLRKLVEIYSHVDQDTDRILAILDNENSDYFMPKVSLRKPKTNVFVGLESFYRPIVKWYDKRIIDRYRPPKTPKVIILLPCSARKPYSTSKSHTAFKNAIIKASAGKSSIIHEVMLTSPIGLVPRELEMTYPNAHYDTTTTGNWNEWELEHTAKLLEVYLRKKEESGRVEAVIVHLDGGYKEAALRALDRMGYEFYDSAGDNHVTEFTALQNLTETLSSILNTIDIGLESRKERIIEDAMGILSYQYGLDIAEQLIKDSEITGTPYGKSGYQIREKAVFDKEFGLFIPLKKGAEVLISNNKYVVTVSDSSSSIKPGDVINAYQVVKATLDINPGDYVAIANEDGMPMGVGVSMFSGEDLNKFIYDSDVVKVVKTFI